MVQLSVLDLAYIGEGFTPADALNNALDLAQHAEAAGFANADARGSPPRPPLARRGTYPHTSNRVDIPNSTYATDNRLTIVPQLALAGHVSTTRTQDHFTLKSNRESPERSRRRSSNVR